MEEHKILTVYELADILRLHPETVRRLARSGQIPGYRVGRQWRFRLNPKFIDVFKILSE